MTEEWLEGLLAALRDALSLPATADVPTILRAAREADSAGRAVERGLVVAWLRAEAEDDEDGDLLLDVADMVADGLHYGEDDA